MQRAIEPQICKADGCKKELQARNKTGLCPAHHYLKGLHPSGKVCAEPGCGNHLKVSNASGYCPNHRWLQSRASIETRVCAKADCGRELRSDNETGFCRDHTYLADVLPPRKCEAEGCSNTIGHNSKSGLCHMHFNQRYANENREAATKRQAEFRARQQTKLARKFGGRPSEDPDVIAKIRELKRQNMSWPMIAKKMNKETGTNRTPGAYRYLAR
jgi:hypothetical protein